MYINVYIYIYKSTYIVHCIYRLYIILIYIYIERERYIYVYIRIFERDSPFLSKDEPEG